MDLSTCKSRGLQNQQKPAGEGGAWRPEARGRASGREALRVQGLHSRHYERHLISIFSICHSYVRSDLGSEGSLFLGCCPL